MTAVPNDDATVMELVKRFKPVSRGKTDQGLWAVFVDPETGRRFYLQPDPYNKKHYLAGFHSLH